MMSRFMPRVLQTPHWKLDLKLLCQTPAKPGKRCRSQAGGNAVIPGGDAQQASATRATMTTVAVMGSMGFSCLDHHPLFE